MSNRAFSLVALTFLLVLLIPQKSSASGCPGGGKNRANISITTYISDFDLNNLPSTIASDGLGAYADGVAGVTSFLTANTCNCLPTGDWRLDSTNSPTRTGTLAPIHPPSTRECHKR